MHTPLIMTYNNWTTLYSVLVGNLIDNGMCVDKAVKSSTLSYEYGFSITTHLTNNGPYEKMYHLHFADANTQLMFILKYS